MRDLRSRIETRVEIIPESGCWIWMGTLFHKTNYGMIFVGKRRSAHRVAYEAFVGPIPRGLCVLHRCDVPPCVCPHHLFVGTNLDNTQDMIRKGRAAPPLGEAHGFAKLTDFDVLAIRLDTRSYNDIGRAFGVCTSSVSNVKNGITWSHLS